MKKSHLSLLVIAVLSISTVQAQTKAPPAPTKGHRVGLIDMAHVFQNYKKFEGLRNNLQAEIEKSDAEAKGKVEHLQKMQGELKKYDSGSAQYEAAEKKVLEGKGDFDAFRASTQRRLARRESEMFKTIYTDVTAAVKLYAEYAKFDHVMRYNRKDVSDAMPPQEAVQTMNKTFIYTKSENDITKVVLDYLNNKYAKDPTPRTSSVRPVSGTGGQPPIRR